MFQTTNQICVDPLHPAPLGNFQHSFTSKRFLRATFRAAAFEQLRHLLRAPQWRAFFDLSFSNLHSHKTWEKHSVSQLFYLFTHLDLLTTQSFSSDSFSSLTALTTFAASVHTTEVWLLNFLRFSWFSNVEMGFLIHVAPITKPCPFVMAYI